MDYTFYIIHVFKCVLHCVIRLFTFINSIKTKTKNNECPLLTTVFSPLL